MEMVGLACSDDIDAGSDGMMRSRALSQACMNPQSHDVDSDTCRLLAVYTTAHGTKVISTSSKSKISKQGVHINTPSKLSTSICQTAPASVQPP